MMKRLFIMFAASLWWGVGMADDAKPWTFWYWMYGAVTKPGIKADLQTMKDTGLGGCYLMPIRGTAEAPATLPPLPTPDGLPRAQQLSDTFWDMVDYAFAQADSLGLQMGIHICDGFALAGGPWITPEESMQQVVWTDTVVVVSRAQKAAALFPRPAVGYDGYYEDIAAFACAVWDEGKGATPAVTGTITRDDNGVFRAKEPGYIQYSFDRPVTVRSLEIIPNGNNLQSQRLLVQAGNDNSGTSFSDVRQLVPPRQGWQNNSQNYTYALPETTARHFRFVWTPDGTEPGAEDLDAAKWSPVLKLKDIRLSAEPRIDQYESKNASIWRIAAPYSATEMEHGRQPVRLDAASVLSPGTYRIIRFGHTSTGQTNATAGGARGLECDKLSAAAVVKQVSNWFGAFKKRPHSNVVKYMHVDSWECGSQNWTRDMADEFRRRRGYDLLPYMPVYAGIPMANHEQVLYDIRLTINELLQERFFGTIAAMAAKDSIRLSCESVAPTMVSDGMEHYRYADIPMGEFWLNSPTHDKPNDMLDAISGAHIYGKNIVQAEGFTEVRGVWDETPASIKPLLDRNFALGMNRLFFHVFTHNPYMDRKPGMTLDGIGLFFQRDQTWMAEAKALVGYVTRCQRLLQEGRPVVDIAVYTGEEMPRRSVRPDKLVPMLPGLFGAERVADEQRRLANVGQPMEESPVGVNHSAGIPNLKDWINPLHGYQYDSMNPDALMNNSFNYRVLVVPENVIVGDDARHRTDELRQQGVIIIDRPYHAATIANLSPDVAGLPDGIAYAHRKSNERDIYFVANQHNSTRTFTATIRTAGRRPVVYNPVTNETAIPDYTTGDTTTSVTLTLPAYGSAFVIFADDDAMRVAEPVTTCLHQRPPRTAKGWKLVGGWDVEFAENGIRLHSDTLFDWSRHSASDSIRYYSGHVRYTTILRVKGKPGRTKLSLGTVYDIATVRVNGIDCGTVWTAPYEADVTAAIRKGRNLVEIDVVNTWHNALRGADGGRPPFGVIWTNARYRTKGNGLLPAGLMGPVTLDFQ